MNPQAVTVGARFGRRLTPILVIGAKRSADRASFCGGVIASLAGAVAGLVGSQTAAELLRIALGKLEGKPQLELPAGARLAIAAADAPDDGEAPEIIDTRDEQVEALRRVLAAVSTKAGIPSPELVALLDEAIDDIRQGRPPRPPAAANDDAVACGRCRWAGVESQLVDGEACPECKLVLP